MIHTLPSLASLITRPRTSLMRTRDTNSHTIEKHIEEAKPMYLREGEIDHEWHSFF